MPIFPEGSSAVLADPTLVKAHQTFWMDVDIDHGANYGNTRIYSDKTAPHLGEQPVEIVTDIDGTRFTDAFIAAMQKQP